MDNRQALTSGTKIDDSITITREIGRGGSCIVYDASRVDTTKTPHKIRIRECYPVWLKISRDEFGNLTASELDAENFAREKERFSSAYRNASNIRHIIGLTNSTVDLSDMLQINNTLYAVMSFDEGIDYGQYHDKSVKELFQHLKSLALIIQKYHQNGYLHLDIKPENVLIIPETSEHVKLFDFDSLQSVKTLHDGENLLISYSEGFSAPEQVHKKLNKIGFHTDIYSIGAILFYKLFNRKPDFIDGSQTTIYDFSLMNYQDIRYQPGFFRKLAEFLRRTIALSISSRWSKIAVVIEKLDELIKLSEIERVFVYDNFQYNSANFLGREHELSEINSVLRDNNLVFLSGIGGIGKTELARKYAAIHRNSYGTIIFCKYTTSIIDLVIDEISINKIGREENETREDFYQRKLAVLREVLTPSDLIIIDNFDSEEDANLGDILACPCKFIITTREDFRDYNYCQIDIEKITDIDEINGIFRVYNDTAYTEREFDYVERIINFVDNHTMTVELIAKYLRETGENPEKLYMTFLEKEGVTRTDDTRIRQRKDNKLLAAGVNKHLSILFDVSNFSAQEKEIMMSLSLFGNIRIKKTKFIDMLALDNNEALNKLIKFNWVENDENDGKISLHQVILDLVYTNLKPTTDNCQNITRSIIDFLKRKSLNLAERDIRSLVADVFMRRVTGKNLLYAELCLEYGKREYLENAVKVCRNSDNKERWDILQRLYRKRIKYLSEVDIVEAEEMEEEGEDFHDYCVGKLNLISSMFDETIEFCKKYSSEAEYLCVNYIETALTFSDAIESEIMYISDDEFEPELNAIYEKIISTLDEAAEKLHEAKAISPDDKVKLLEKLRDFYDPSDYSAFYRLEHFADPEKRYLYQCIIDEIKKPKKNVIEIGRVTLSELASDYEMNGNYEKAVEYYEKACDEEPDEFNFYELAQIYTKTGHHDKAIEVLKDMLRAEDYPDYACVMLIDILISQNKLDEADFFAHELIRHNKHEDYSAIFEGYYEDKTAEAGFFAHEVNDDKYSLAATLEGYYKLFIIHGDEKFWELSLKYYDMLKAKEPDSYILNDDFLRGYFERLPISEESLREMNNFLKRLDFPSQESIINTIYKRLIDTAASLECYVKYLMDYTMYISDNIYGRIEEAMKNCETAQSVLDQNEIDNDYLQSLIYRVQSKIMSGMSDLYTFEEVSEIRRKTNYILIAETEGGQEDYEAWEDVASSYGYIDDYEKRLYCLKRAEQILTQNSNFDFDKYYNLAINIIECHSHLKNSHEIRTIAYKLCEEALTHYEPEQDKMTLARRIEQLASYLEKVADDEAFMFYFFAVYVSVASEIDRVLIVNVMRSEEGYEQDFIRELKILMTQDFTHSQVDFITDINKKLTALTPEKTNREIYYVLIKSFSLKYQFSEFDL